MTPYELNLYLSEYTEKQKIEQEEKITLAYLTAYWQRVQKMPSLKEILGKVKPKEPMTPEQMLKQVQVLNAMFGGEVKENSN